MNWAPYTAITGLRYHAPNDLIAFSCEDLTVKVVDIETKKMVRELRGCLGKINDLVSWIPVILYGYTDWGCQSASLMMVDGS